MGIAAATAGIVVGNMSFPHAEEVRHFKGDLTQIGIGVIFVLLAARLRFADLRALGWGGVAVVATLMLVVRPVSAFLATIGTRLSLRERLFIAAVGPRGIVAASFATFAALRLDETGYAGSQLLVGLVFLVIIGTVVIQSFTTPWAARLLGVQPMLTLIVGADPLGRDPRRDSHRGVRTGLRPGAEQFRTALRLDRPRRQPAAAAAGGVFSRDRPAHGGHCGGDPGPAEPRRLCGSLPHELGGGWAATGRGRVPDLLVLAG
jgi:hypothetical protein